MNSSHPTQSDNLAYKLFRTSFFRASTISENLPCDHDGALKHSNEKASVRYTVPQYSGDYLTVGVEDRESMLVQLQKLGFDRRKM